VDVLQAIYTRHHLQDEDFQELVCPMFTPGSVTLLRQVYDWTLSDMNIQDLNEQKYTLCKKIAEVRFNDPSTP
jgi:exportin-5